MITWVFYLYFHLLLLLLNLEIYTAPASWEASEFSLNPGSLRNQTLIGRGTSLQENLTHRISYKNKIPTMWIWDIIAGSPVCRGRKQQIVCYDRVKAAKFSKNYNINFYINSHATRSARNRAPWQGRWCSFSLLGSRNFQQMVGSGRKFLIHYYIDINIIVIILLMLYITPILRYIMHYIDVC